MKANREKRGGGCVRATRHHRFHAGFTLVEIIVAMTILMTLMAGLLLLFAGSIRTARQGQQTIEAFEDARGALAVLTNDLTTGFTARDYAENFAFYGTPIGMTFVAVVKNSTDPKLRDINICRITYVIYNKPSGKIPDTFFSEAFEIPTNDGDSTYLPGYCYPLLRYVEPNVADLDSFPVDWDNLTCANNSSMTLTEFIEQEANAAACDDAICGLACKNCCEGVCGNNNPQCSAWDSSSCPECMTCREEFRKAKKREIWIRMLAGGDDQIPSAWEGRDGAKPIIEQSFTNYIVTDNILSTLSSEERSQQPFGGTTFFNYDRDYPTAITNDTTGTSVIRTANVWWNDARSLNCNPSKDWRSGAGSKNAKYCDAPGLPQVVNADFWLMYSAPTPSGPDFRRRFSQQIFVPSAYVRVKDSD